MRTLLVLAAAVLAPLGAFGCDGLKNDLKADPAASSVAAPGVNASPTGVTVGALPAGTVAVNAGSVGATAPGAAAVVSAAPGGSGAAVVNANGTKVVAKPNGATNVQTGGVKVQTDGKGGSTVVVPGVGTVVTH